MTAASRLGATIQGKYHLERVLGEGGMGVVYGARHMKLDRPVAIKVMHASFAASDAAVQRFFDEARAAGRLRHPNVIDVLDVDVDESNAPFMVMEMLEGESLASLLARRGPMPAEEVVALLDPVLDGLTAAHASGIVHRDLKPDNVFLARVGASTVPKILDFGIAKLRDARTPGTATGAIVGTPMYMAPEQAAGSKEIGPWVDVWAMGAVYFEAITGRSHLELPADAGVMAILSALATTTPRRLAELAPSAPPFIAAAIDAALVSDPARRTRSVEGLRQALGGRSIAPTEASPSATATPLPPTRVLPAPTRKRTGLWIAAAIVLSSIVGLAVWAATNVAAPAAGTASPAHAPTGGDSRASEAWVPASERPEASATRLEASAERPEASVTRLEAPPSTVDAVTREPAGAEPAGAEPTPTPSGTRARPRARAPQPEASPTEGTPRAPATRTGTWNPDEL